MKKIIFFIAFFSFCMLKINAQVKVPVGTTSPTVEDVLFYEQPNYRGNSGKISFVRSIMTFPFANKKNVSFRVTAGKIAYIKFCADIPYEQAYVGEISNLDLSLICGIRIDEIQLITLSWCGIGAVIHNNDCKKVFGNIQVKFKEIAPDGTENFLPLQQAKPGPDKVTFVPFSKANAETANEYGNFVVANRNAGVVTNAVRMNGYGPVQCVLPIGKTAIRDGRVSMIITSDIKSAHKSDNYALDYSSNIHMERPVTSVVPINYLYSGNKLVNAEKPNFFVGPYTANGSPDNTTLASGGLFHDFSVLFYLSGL